MWSNYRIKRLLSGVRYAFYANVMLRLWRPRVTNCAIVSPRSQLHSVLTVAIPGEARSLMVRTAAWHARGRRFAPRTNWKNSAVFSAFLFYREAFCYFQEAKLFHYIFLKKCAVMCEVIQLLYSNDQYPFNGQMRTGTGPALVIITRRVPV